MIGAFYADQSLVAGGPWGIRSDALTRAQTLLRTHANALKPMRARQNAVLQGLAKEFAPVGVDEEALQNVETRVPFQDAERASALLQNIARGGDLSLTNESWIAAIPRNLHLRYPRRGSVSIANAARAVFANARTRVPGLAATMRPDELYDELRKAQLLRVVQRDGVAAKGWMVQKAARVVVDTIIPFTVGMAGAILLGSVVVSVLPGGLLDLVPDAKKVGHYATVSLYMFISSMTTLTVDGTVSRDGIVAAIKKSAVDTTRGIAQSITVKSVVGLVKGASGITRATFAGDLMLSLTGAYSTQLIGHLSGIFAQATLAQPNAIGLPPTIAEERDARLLAEIHAELQARKRLDAIRARLFPKRDLTWVREAAGTVAIVTAASLFTGAVVVAAWPWISTVIFPALAPFVKQALTIQGAQFVAGERLAATLSRTFAQWAMQYARMVLLQPLLRTAVNGGIVSLLGSLVRNYPSLGRLFQQASETVARRIAGTMLASIIYSRVFTAVLQTFFHVSMDTIVSRSVARAVVGGLGGIEFTGLQSAAVQLAGTFGRDFLNVDPSITEQLAQGILQEMFGYANEIGNDIKQQGAFDRSVRDLGLNMNAAQGQNAPQGQNARTGESIFVGLSGAQASRLGQAVLEQSTKDEIDASSALNKFDAWNKARQNLPDTAKQTISQSEYKEVIQPVLAHRDARIVKGLESRAASASATFDKAMREATKAQHRASVLNRQTAAIRQRQLSTADPAEQIRLAGSVAQQNAAEDALNAAGRNAQREGEVLQGKLAQLYQDIDRAKRLVGDPLADPNEINTALVHINDQATGIKQDATKLEADAKLAGKAAIDAGVTGNAILDEKESRGTSAAPRLSKALEAELKKYGTSAANWKDFLSTRIASLVAQDLGIKSNELTLQQQIDVLTAVRTNVDNQLEGANAASAVGAAAEQSPTEKPEAKMQCLLNPRAVGCQWNDSFVLVGGRVAIVGVATWFLGAPAAAAAAVGGGVSALRYAATSEFTRLTAMSASAAVADGAAGLGNPADAAARAEYAASGATKMRDVLDKVVEASQYVSSLTPGLQFSAAQFNFLVQRDVMKGIVTGDVATRSLVSSAFHAGTEAATLATLGEAGYNTPQLQEPALAALKRSGDLAGAAYGFIASVGFG